MSEKEVNINVNPTGGIGFVGALSIAFIVLKLCHVISWPWVWVLSPIWISLAATFAILGIILFVVLVAVGIAYAMDK